MQVSICGQSVQAVCTVACLGLCCIDDMILVFLLDNTHQANYRHMTAVVPALQLLLLVASTPP